MREVKIVGVGGSFNPTSSSITALVYALEGAQESGAVTELINLAELNLPFFVPGKPVESYAEAATIQTFLDKVREADGLLFASPVYHGTLSGLWKNGIDFLELLPRTPTVYLEGKVVGLIALAGGPFAAPNGITALQHTARALRATVAPLTLPLGPTRKLFDGQGRLTEPQTLEGLHSLGQQVVALAQTPKEELLKIA